MSYEAFRHLDMVDGDVIVVNNQVARGNRPAEEKGLFPDLFPSQTLKPHSNQSLLTVEDDADSNQIAIEETTEDQAYREAKERRVASPSITDVFISKTSLPRTLNQRTTTPSVRSSSSCLREQVRAGTSKRADFPINSSKTALLIIDIQKYCCETMSAPSYYREEALPRMMENAKLLLQNFREQRDSQSSGPEVIFTIIQSMTNNARDISLDYKLSGPGFANIPAPSTPPNEIFMDGIQPNSNGKGDICIPKTSCSVFVSTNLDYVLRNLFVEQLVICGQLTDQCVESAVRDAADLGYLVTVVEDACAAHSLDHHQKGLSGMGGFCRIVPTKQVLCELTVSNQEQMAEKREMSTSTAQQRRCSW